MFVAKTRYFEGKNSLAQITSVSSADGEDWRVQFILKVNTWVFVFATISMSKTLVSSSGS